MTFHHVGCIVTDIEESAQFYEQQLNMERYANIIHDPIQRVDLLFLRDKNFPQFVIELIKPVYEDSPSAQWLRKGNTLQHFCYEVDDLNAKIDEMVEHGSHLFMSPKPAIAFENRRIAFLLTREKLIIELLERKRAE